MGEGVKATRLSSVIVLAALAAASLAACWDSASLKVEELATGSGDGGAPSPSPTTDGAAPLPTSSPDGGLACVAPLAVCGQVCTDTRVDPFNCGACGVSCAAPQPPTCVGQVATAFGPGMCGAGTCTYPTQTIDCAAQGRACARGLCGPCLPGFQDNDLNGTCLPACTLQTCSGHGACNDVTGTPACACDVGFTGPTCAVNIDDCALAPCKNGGQCVDGIADYTCTCPAGFSGKNCEVLKPTFLWVDATDPATITKDVTDHVTEWRDKSGLGRHATVPAGSAPPMWAANLVNGLPAIIFDGGTIRLQTQPVPTSAEMTIFIAFNMVNPMTWGSLLNQSHDTYFSVRKSDCCGGNGNLNFHIQNNNGAPLQPITTNQWKVVTAMRQGNVSTLYYSQQAATSFAGDTLTGGVNVPVTIGNAMAVAESMGGFIAEIRAFGSALDSASRAAIEDDLKKKYAIP